MLVIISDLHLTDGSSQTIHQGTLRVFRERLRGLAYAASWRSNGSYEPIREMTVLLLGDIIDVLRSSQWLKDGAPRPWDDSRDPVFASKVASITYATLAKNSVFFEMLRDLNAGAMMTLPAAAAARPATNSARRDAARIPVRVQIYYMAGNHDWYFHLPHSAYNPVRAQIAAALGLANNPNQPFPHDLNEPSAGAIKNALDEHRVFVRHGDIFDAFNYEGDRDAASLGDAIVIDLVTRFSAEVKSSMRNSLSPECVAGLNEIDNVRPLMMAPVWVAGLLRRACPDLRQRRLVEETWNGLVDQFLRIPFVRDRISSRRRFMTEEKLRLGLLLSKRVLRPEAGKLLLFLHEKLTSAPQSYCSHALTEEAFARGQARFIVYGHTHRHEMTPLRAASAAGGSAIYLNSGTWRPVIELSRFHPEGEAFVEFNTMTYVAFFKGDERSGRTFESWSGNLARSGYAPAAPPFSHEEWPASDTEAAFNAG